MSILSRPCPPFKVRERNDLECITCVIYIMRIQPAEVGRRESALRNIMPRVFRPVAASIVQVTAVLTGRDPETMALARTPRPPSEEFLFREHYTATPDPLACDFCEWISMIARVVSEQIVVFWDRLRCTSSSSATLPCSDEQNQEGFHDGFTQVLR
jgi:hypothetical protein